VINRLRGVIKNKGWESRDGLKLNVALEHHFVTMLNKD
jgi:hypothetical protein